MPDINDLLGSVISKNPTEFSSNLSDIMRDRALEAINNRRMEIAATLYVEPEPETETDVKNVADHDDFDIDLALDDIDDDIPSDNDAE